MHCYCIVYFYFIFSLYNNKSCYKNYLKYISKKKKNIKKLLILDATKFNFSLYIKRKILKSDQKLVLRNKKYFLFKSFLSVSHGDL